MPIRGDVAHIALAQSYLVPHYVVPNIAAVAAGPAPIYLAEDETSEILATLETGTDFEVLDFTSSWVWGSCGPTGPSGYVMRSAFDI